MSFWLSWIVVGVIVGWAFKRFLPSADVSLTAALIAGVVGAIIGGYLTLGRGALGPSVMAAVLGAVVVSGGLTAYRLRQKRA